MTHCWPQQVHRLRLITASIPATGFASLAAETYGDIYLQGIASAVAAGDPAALLATIDAGWRDGDAAADDARPLLDIFRVGVYGGHRQSLQVVEHELQTLPPGETSVIGRSQFATVVTQLNAAETLVADLEDSATNLREALDAADVRAVSAREHIAFLERESAQFQRERDNLFASTSWKLTRPLRLVVRVVQRASRVCAGSVQPAAPRPGAGAWRHDPVSPSRLAQCARTAATGVPPRPERLQSLSCPLVPSITLFRWR